MKDERWRQIEEVYRAALGHEVAERDAFLTGACGDDIDLRCEVESLLKYAAAASAFIERPAFQVAADLLGDGVDSEVERLADDPCLQRGSRLGPYEIVERLGSGGMGDVYKAYDTRLGRTVAIKTLPSDLATDPDRRERFRREARAISSLAHPHICTLHDVGEQNGVDFLVMEYLAGETLTERLLRGPLPLDDALTAATEIADALDAAHGVGIIHRDIKPSNVLVMTNGHVKVLDFGLAKGASSLSPGASAIATAKATNVETSPPDTMIVAARAIQLRNAVHRNEAGARTAVTRDITGTGHMVGSPAYMSPEQIRGEDVDARTDLFSFGLVLYEMATGRPAFAGAPSRAIGDAILNETPQQPSRLNGNVPAALEAVIGKALEKDRDLRYQNACALREDLQRLRARRFSRRTTVAVALLILAIAVFAASSWRRSSRERWALETAIPEITRFADAGQFAKAAALAQNARTILPHDPTLDKLWIRSTLESSLQTVPAGADLSIRDYRDGGDAWLTVGSTPLKIRLPRTEYVWRISKPGFAPAFVIRGSDLVPQPGLHQPLELIVKLRPEHDVPSEMVPVSGGLVGLGYPLGQAPVEKIDDYLIDRHEVTNEEYKRFVDAGGYQRREFWKYAFVKDGKKLSWEEAVDLFRDATGRLGPSTWEDGRYAEGMETHPVAGVSWFEASAYSEFAGKSLPTAYHWTRAAQTGFAPLITAGSNLRGAGTQPVGGPGTLSGFGTVDMAGNVKEWCINEGHDGKRFVLGGGFGEPPYMFNFTDAQLPWTRRANVGFRCVKLTTPASAAASAHIEVTSREFFSEKPVSDEVFNAFRGLYAYDKSELNARVEESTALPGWMRQKVTFDAASGRDRIIAHLFLPNGISPPFQPVVYFPGAFALLDETLAPSTIEDALDFLLKSGRAVMVPIYKGTYDRRDGLLPGGKPLGVYRDHVIVFSKDLGRSLDYLETRRDIDTTKIAYMGFSFGAKLAPVFLAVEPRIKTAILSSGGFELRYDLPEVSPFNFVTRVHIPVLMLNGRYDDSFPLESSQVPFFRLLGTVDKDKRHVVYEAGHGNLPHRDEVRESLDWLDKYLGPISR